MTRYSPIIGSMLAWQLLMPVLCFFSGALWPTVVTAVMFAILLTNKNWERNSYSKYSAIVVVAFSCLLSVLEITTQTRSLASIAFVFWIYAQIAFTATSPYPLSIRMPVIIYTLACAFMVPKGTSAVIVITAALIFSAVMCALTMKWRAKTMSLTISVGPDEPPYSFSLATAIVSAVTINLGLTVAGYLTSSKIPGIISLCLLSLLCVWLLCATDWKKNVLAVTALALMITLHVASGCNDFIHNRAIGILTFLLSVSPVMFHTTAPVFRGMRIVITLYAVYSALNKPSLIAVLSSSSIPLWQQHGLMIAIDAVLTLTLFLMAIHWKNNRPRRV